MLHDARHTVCGVAQFGGLLAVWFIAFIGLPRRDKRLISEPALRVVASSEHLVLKFQNMLAGAFRC